MKLCPCRFVNQRVCCLPLMSPVHSSKHWATLEHQCTIPLQFKKTSIHCTTPLICLQDVGVSANQGDSSAKWKLSQWVKSPGPWRENSPLQSRRQGPSQVPASLLHTSAHPKDGRKTEHSNSPLLPLQLQLQLQARHWNTLTRSCVLKSTSPCSPSTNSFCYAFPTDVHKIPNAQCPHRWRSSYAESWRTEREQSRVFFQEWHFLLDHCVLLSLTGRYSQAVFKQMTPGFPAIDHHKNTPTAYCSLLPTQHHPLAVPTALFLSYP